MLCDKQAGISPDMAGFLLYLTVVEERGQPKIVWRRWMQNIKDLKFMPRMDEGQKSSSRESVDKEAF